MAKFTLIARGPKDRGHRFWVEAPSAEKAIEAAAYHLRESDLEFVAVFKGNMAALKYIYPPQVGVKVAEDDGQMHLGKRGPARAKRAKLKLMEVV